MQNKKLFSATTVNRLKMSKWEGEREGKKRRDTGLSFGKENEKFLSITTFKPSEREKEKRK